MLTWLRLLHAAESQLAARVTCCSLPVKLYLFDWLMIRFALLHCMLSHLPLLLLLLLPDSVVPRVRVIWPAWPSPEEQTAPLMFVTPVTPRCCLVLASCRRELPAAPVLPGLLLFGRAKLTCYGLR
jgi:hypothetical protein